MSSPHAWTSARVIARWHGGAGQRAAVTYAERHVERDHLAQRRRRLRDHRVHDAAYRRVRGPEAYNHYAVGWAHAMDTPYQWTKQVASHFGGTRNGTIVHWPNGFMARGEIRSQFHHIIDVAATIPGRGRSSRADLCQRDPADLFPRRFDGYAFDDAGAPERRETSVLRSGLQPRHLSEGLDRGNPSQHTVGVRGDAARARRRRLGAVRDQHRLVPSARRRRRNTPTSSRSCSVCG